MYNTIRSPDGAHTVSGAHSLVLFRLSSRHSSPFLWARGRPPRSRRAGHLRRLRNLDGLRLRLRRRRGLLAHVADAEADADEQEGAAEAAADGAADDGADADGGILGCTEELIDGNSASGDAKRRCRAVLQLAVDELEALQHAFRPLPFAPPPNLGDAGAPVPRPTIKDSAARRRTIRLLQRRCVRLAARLGDGGRRAKGAEDEPEWLKSAAARLSPSVDPAAGHTDPHRGSPTLDGPPPPKALPPPAASAAPGVLGRAAAAARTLLSGEVKAAGGAGLSPLNRATLPDGRRALLMFCSPTVAPLDTSREVTALRDASLLAPDVAVVQGGSLDALRRALREWRPHLFWFAGHGDVGLSDEQRTLGFSGSDGTLQLFDPLTLASELRAHIPLQGGSHVCRGVPGDSQLDQGHLRGVGLPVDDHQVGLLGSHGNVGGDGHTIDPLAFKVGI